MEDWSPMLMCLLGGVPSCRDASAPFLADVFEPALGAVGADLMAARCFLVPRGEWFDGPAPAFIA
eukprot:4894906-Lingulodinium_polyedra.AAC.1